MSTTADFLTRYKEQLAGQINSQAAAYQAHLIDQAIEHNKASAIRRKAQMAVTVNTRNANVLRERISFWMEHTPKSALNRGWDWGELHEKFDRPFTLLLASVLRGFGWHQVAYMTDHSPRRRERTKWYPPTAKKPNETELNIESLRAVLDGLPKAPIKLPDIQKRFTGVLLGRVPHFWNLGILLRQLGWRRWRDNKGANWWLSPETKTPTYPRPKPKPKPKSTRPPGRPRKQPLPEQSQ